MSERVCNCFQWREIVHSNHAARRCLINYAIGPSTLKLDSIWCLSIVNAKLQLLARVWNFQWSLRKKRLWWFCACIVGLEVPVGLVWRIFQTRSSTNVYRAYPETHSVCYSCPVSLKCPFRNLTATTAWPRPRVAEYYALLPRSLEKLVYFNLASPQT